MRLKLPDDLQSTLSVLRRVDFATMSEINDISTSLATFDNSSISGWVPYQTTMTYVQTLSSPTEYQMSMPEADAQLLQRGTRVRLNGNRYFVVTKQAGTLVNLNGGSDYSANITVTSIDISLAPRPYGFPSSFNWTPSFPVSAGGMTYTLTASGSLKFMMQGTLATVLLKITGTTGGIADNQIRMELPLYPDTSTTFRHAVMSVSDPNFDNSFIAIGGDTIYGDIYKNQAAGNFGLGINRTVEGIFQFEVGIRP